MASYQIDGSNSVYLPSNHHFSTVPEIHKIRDWLPWSIVNIFLGWGLGGLIPLLFTILCRNEKRANDLKSARTMSLLSLVFNIIATIGGIIGWISLIILLVGAHRLSKLS